MKNWILYILAGLLVSQRAAAHSPHDHIEAFAVSPGFEEDGTILIVMRNHLFRTTDGGKEWRRIARGLDNRFQFMAAAMGGGMAYLGSKGDGVFRSSDGGKNWERANVGFGTSNIRGLMVAGNHVFASSKAKGVYRAEVGKEVWKVVVERGDEDRVTAMGASADGTVVVMGDEKGGVSISRDGGEKWSQRKVISEAGSIFSVLVTADGVVLLGTRRDGVMVFAEDGTVTAFGEGLEGGAVTALEESGDGGLFATTWEGGVFYKGKGGKKWEQRSDGTSKHEQADERGLPHFTNLAMTGNSGAGSLFLGAYDGLFRSEDGGNQWVEVETLPLSMILDFDISMDRDGTVALLVGTYWRGPVLSVDGGDSWKAIGLGLAEKWRVKPEEKMMRGQSVAFGQDYAGDGSIYVGGRNTMMVSRDRGESWEKWDLGTVLKEDDLIVDRIVFSPSFKGDGVMFFAARAGHNETRRPAVFRSEDSGATFEKVHEGEGEYAQSLVISPEFPDDGVVLWASGADRGGKVYRSEDGGGTWKECGEGLEQDVQGAELAISPRFGEDGTVFAGTSEGFFRSVDGGKRWSKEQPEGLPEGGWVEAIDVSRNFGDEGKVAVAVSVRGFGHFLSKDGGMRFQPMSESGLMEENHLLTKAWYYSPAKVLRFPPRFSDDTRMFGTTGMAVLRSKEGGEGWEELPAREAANAFEGVVMGKVWPWVWGGAGGIVVLLVGWWKWRKRSTSNSQH